MTSFRNTEHTIDPDLFTASPEYARRFDGEVGHYFLNVQRRGVLQLLSQLGERPLEILELGGGHLQITKDLINLGHKVTVHASAASGLEKFHQSGISANKAVFPLADLGSQKSEYDVVIALRLIPHVLDIKALLANCSKISREALIFDFASTKGMNFLSPLLFQIKKQIEKNTRPYLCHSEGKLKEILKENGFPNIKSIPQFFFPMGIHRKLKDAKLSSRLETGAEGLGLTALFGNPVIMGAFRK